MAEKKALKGLKKVTLHPVTENTDEKYVVGAKLALPAAQSLSKEDQREEFEIFADDDIYDKGSDFTSTTLTVTLAELDPSLEAQLSGGAFDETEGVYTAKTTDVAPEYCLGYAALMSSGGYRLFRHPVVKLTQVSVSHETKGSSNDIAPYELTFVGTARKIDGAYREQKDVAKDDGFTWLETVEQLPAQGG